MTRRAKATEANRRGLPAVVRTKHSTRTSSSQIIASPSVLRMPSNYTLHDVELLLDALWIMFTGKQAARLIVPVPWDTSEEPQRMRLADLAGLLESWLS